MWLKNELEDFIGTDYVAFVPEQPSVSSDRLKLLCKVVEAHMNPQSRIGRLNDYYVEEEPRHTITVRRTNDEHRQPRQIRIHRRENGGHHED